MKYIQKKGSVTTALLGRRIATLEGQLPSSHQPESCLRMNQILFSGTKDSETKSIFGCLRLKQNMKFKNR